MCPRLLVALAKGADEYGRGTTSVRHLARAAGTTSRTARSHLPHLVERHRLTVRVPDGAQVLMPMPYWVWPPLPEVAGGDR
ncbi:hypothetical protein ABZX88_34445 [Kitasatospora aureofaciens]|uniref:hypothetical protein n=1 Tax=Kitasatospora aureofaciens TaxID=1894 RepID=UPI0033AC8AE4